MNINLRAAALHLYRIFKVYLSVWFIAALTAIGWGLIDAKPWIGVILFVLLEGLVLVFYLLSKTERVLELGSVRIEFGNVRRSRKSLVENTSR